MDALVALFGGIRCPQLPRRPGHVVDRHNDTYQCYNGIRQLCIYNRVARGTLGEQWVAVLSKTSTCVPRASTRHAESLQRYNTGVWFMPPAPSDKLLTVIDDVAAVWAGTQADGIEPVIGHFKVLF